MAIEIVDIEITHRTYGLATTAAVTWCLTSDPVEMVREPIVIDLHIAGRTTEAAWNNGDCGPFTVDAIDAEKIDPPVLEAAFLALAKWFEAHPTEVQRDDLR